MIQFRALGTLVLRYPDGADVRAVLAQPKRVALLAYLALARPHGFHRRDTLLALLWPEQDERHARWALNQALRHLRNAVGKEAVSSRGDGEVGINSDSLWCDAVEFAAAVEQNDLARALELYRGDLLDGFHVSGCGEFERWLEQERVWLKGRAARAASALAEREAAKGDSIAAADWARRAFTLAQDDEGETRRLIELLGRVGDRAGAVQAYEEFARRLREEYEADPAPETRATIAAVRTREQTVPVPPEASDEPAHEEKELLPAAAPPVSQAFRPRRLARARSLVLGFILLAVGGTALWSRWTPRNVVPALAASSSTIAVFPFAYRGEPEFAYLGDGMVDLLSADLNGAGEIHAADPRAVLGLTRPRAGGSPDPPEARKVASRLNAGSFVLGEVVEIGGRLRISAWLQSAMVGKGLTQATVDGTPTQLFQLVDALAIQLLKIRREDHGGPLVDLAALTTDSLAALKAYLAGEHWFRAGQFEPAIEALQRAITIDTTFALAYYRLATAAGWDDRPTLAHAAVDRAVRHSRRLGDRERMLIDALVAFDRGRHVEAERLYRQIVTRYPNDVEAWFQLGDVILHRGQVSWLEAREPFERVLAVEPRHASALWHLSNIATREGKRAELDSLTDRILQLDPPPMRAAMARAQRAALAGDSAELERFMSVIRKAPDYPAQPAAGMVTFTTGDLTLGRRLWRLIADPSRAKGTRVLGHKTLAQIELMSGRWRAAQIELDSMAALDPATALEHRALFALWPLQRVSRADLLALRNSLLHWKATAGPPNEKSLIAEHSPAHPYLRLYLLGLLDARLGQPGAALVYAAELERRAGSAFAPLFVADLARTVRTEVARSRGHFQEALRILEGASYWAATEAKVTGNSPFYVHEYEMLIRADLLYLLGRYDEALRIYQERAGQLFHSGAPAHLRLAQIYERQGERQKAAEHYARFAELWKNCDPELRPLVDQAKQHTVQ